MSSINYWTNRKGKRIATKSINNQLVKEFVGHKLNPIDELFAKMRKVVIKYFKNKPEQLSYFTNSNETFDYNFEIEEKNGFVTNIDFQPLPIL